MIALQIDSLLSVQTMLLLTKVHFNNVITTKITSFILFRKIIFYEANLKRTFTVLPTIKIYLFSVPTSSSTFKPSAM